jgi:DNA-binding CsgD family transcriptional regulator
VPPFRFTTYTLQPVNVLQAERPAARRVEWDSLSKQGLETLRMIALPIACGLSYQEVAERRGLTTKAVSRALDVLAEEIRSQTRLSSS